MASAAVGTWSWAPERGKLGWFATTFTWLSAAAARHEDPHFTASPPGTCGML